MNDRLSFEREIQGLFPDREVRRACQPLDTKAVQAADNQFYAKYTNMVRPDGTRIPLDPSDPKQGTLRTEWMNLYLANGGRAEPDCSNGNLSISVTDRSGIPIPGARVDVDGLGGKSTGANGIADYGSVRPGSYAASARKDGFASRTDDVLVQPGGAEPVIYRLDRLHPGQAGPDETVLFLTFDDGPWAGTKEVYQLLKELDVPATFFFVGENATYWEQVESGLFNLMYFDPAMQIGNHSQTHAHQFYDRYYDTGLRVNAQTMEPDVDCVQRGDGLECVKFRNKGASRSVLMDFEYASISFTGLLTGKTIPRPKKPPQDFRGRLDLSLLSGYSRLLVSRIPGTNIWRLPSLHASHGGTAPKEDEANDLEQNGYLIYGWDLEFSMNFEVKAIQQEEYLHGSDGRFNLYLSKYIDLDRPTMTGEGVSDWITRKFNWILPEGPDRIGPLHKKNKLILLMHERAFRYYKQGNEKRYLNYLRTMIDSCKKKGYKFDVVANY